MREAIDHGVDTAEAAQVAADQLGDGTMTTTARERAKVATARAARHAASAVGAAVNEAQPQRMARSAARGTAAARDQTVEAETLALRRRIQELEGRGSDPGDIEEYPRAMYRKHAVDLKHPHGYEVRRIASAEDQARLPKGWVESPADL